MVTRLEPGRDRSYSATRKPLCRARFTEVGMLTRKRRTQMFSGLRAAVIRVTRGTFRPPRARPSTSVGRSPAAAANAAERNTSPKRAACSALTADRRSASALVGYGSILYSLRHGHRVGRTPKFHLTLREMPHNTQAGAGGGIRGVSLPRPTLLPVCPAIPQGV